jgi:hypothetical protein
MCEKCEKYKRGWVEYEKEVAKSSWKEYVKVCRIAFDEYQKVRLANHPSGGKA